MSPAHTRLNDLTKNFGEVRAVVGVTLEIRPGEVHALLGANGAGKSTLMRCLLGYLQPTSGSVTVLGGDSRDPDIRSRIGYLPGDLRLEPRLTPRQIVRFRQRLLANAGRRVPPGAVTALAERLDLPLDRRFATLSKGNRQKVGVLLAMLADPAVLVLDEPTSGLDPIMQDVVLDLVRERRQAGAATLLSTHILSEAEAIADRVGVLSRGHLVSDTTARELLANARQHLTFTLAETPSEGVLHGTAGVDSFEIRGHDIEVVVTGSARAVVDRLAPLGVLRIRTDSGELDQAFHSIAEQPR